MRHQNIMKLKSVSSLKIVEQHCHNPGNVFIKLYDEDMNESYVFNANEIYLDDQLLASLSAIDLRIICEIMQDRRIMIERDRINELKKIEEVSL